VLQYSYVTPSNYNLERKEHKLNEEVGRDLNRKDIKDEQD
jgi:hypothetical protein